MKLTKEQKQGVAIALGIIKRLQRYDLQWESMSEVADGEYIAVSDAKDALIKFFRDDQAAKEDK